MVGRARFEKTSAKIALRLGRDEAATAPFSPDPARLIFASPPPTRLIFVLSLLTESMEQAMQRFGRGSRFQ